LIRYRSTDEKNLILDINKRFNLDNDDKIIFKLNNFVDNIDEIQIRREKFIKKLKEGEL